MKQHNWICGLVALTVVAGCGDDTAPQDATEAGGTGLTDGSTSTGSTSSGSTSSGIPDTDTDPATGGSTAGSESVGTSVETTEGTSGGLACLEDPQVGIGGEAVPLSEFEFRNAFDPADREVYDPDDAGALPGPLMVDTWGDRGMGPHGTLAVFPPGFVAPLHTHSFAYDGVVLRGEMSNPFGTDLEAQLDEDDTNDHGTTTLQAGSYWHVPAGSQHTTTCLGPEVCWFYFHAEDAFDFAPIVDENGDLQPGITLETPPDDAVLLPNADLEFAGEPGSFVQFAAAWGAMASDAHGTFGLFEAGAVSPVHVHSEDYYGVVVSGTVRNPFDLKTESPLLDRGGYWSVPADSVHTTECGDGEECLFYFHARGGFDFTPLCEQP